MKICVTAANCFIGLPLVNKLLLQGHEVIAAVRKGNPLLKHFQSLANVRALELNFDEYDQLGTLIGPIDCLVLLTWDGTRGEKRLDDRLQKQNFEYAMNAIKSCLAVGCGRIVTAGSQAEYGVIDGVIDERCLCLPNTAYGKYKLALFNALSEICPSFGAKYVEPRYFSLYGPGDYAQSMIMATIAKMRAGLECDFTEATQNWDYLYIDDAIEATAMLATCPCPDGAYNVGSGDHRPLKDYILELKSIVGGTSKLNFGSLPYGPCGPVSICPNISKLCQTFGWRPRFTFAGGIESLLVTCFFGRTKKR